MSSDAYANSINDVLNAYLHQVTGSTAESLKDMVKKAGLQGNAPLAAKFTIVCIFAAAVNKSTVESLIASNDLADVRGLIGSSFSIQSKPNMSALSLLGHAMLTSKFCDKINFAQKFREKIGQRNIWEQDLSRDRLSDKQHEIFTQKKKNNDAKSAQLLGNGYFKVTKMESTPLTPEEATFWGTAPSAAVTGSVGNAGNTSLASTAASSSGTSTMPPRVPTRQAPPVAPASRGESISYTNQDSAVISASALEYFRTCISDNPALLQQAIAKRGPAGFEESMAKARQADPTLSKRVADSKMSSLGL